MDEYDFAQLDFVYPKLIKAYKCDSKNALFKLLIAGAFGVIVYYIYKEIIELHLL